MGGYGQEILINFAFYLPFLAILFFCAYRYNKKRGIATSPLHILGTTFFALYIAGVLNITGTLTMHDILLRGLHVEGDIRLVPFTDTTVFGFVMNIALFVPLGLLTPWIFKSNTTLPSAILLGLLFSLAIEASQMFNLRTSDIDDIIANTLGAVLGFGIYKLFNMAKPATISSGAKSAYLRHEAVIVIAAVFASRFLLMPLIIAVA